MIFEYRAELIITIIIPPRVIMFIPLKLLVISRCIKLVANRRYIAVRRHENIYNNRQRNGSVQPFAVNG